MPSWNIHTAHVERLFADRPPESWGVEDVDAFLLGNYIPDVYLGFMVPDASMRIDYCITHIAEPSTVPVPDADRFWSRYIERRMAPSPAGRSLVLGAWAHLATDRCYNSRFRDFYQTHDTPEGEELRTYKQADFELFGHSLGISSHVHVTPELLEAAWKFRPYRIFPDDVRRTVRVADAIVDNAHACESLDYQLLDAGWMTETFEICNTQLTAGFDAWKQLERTRS